MPTLSVAIVSTVSTRPHPQTLVDSFYIHCNWLLPEALTVKPQAESTSDLRSNISGHMFRIITASVSVIDH